MRIEYEYRVILRTFAFFGKSISIYEEDKYIIDANRRLNSNKCLNKMNSSRIIFFIKKN